MVRLNRTTEYALIALRYMLAKQSLGDASVTSARELADRYALPFEITAKTLQKMKDSGLIASAQGARGGYALARPPSQVSLAEFLELMEGPQAVVGCTVPALAKPTAQAGLSVAPSCACEYEKKCDVRGVMGDLNARVKGFLASIRLTDLAEFQSALPKRAPKNESEVKAL